MTKRVRKMKMASSADLGTEMITTPKISWKGTTNSTSRSTPISMKRRQRQNGSVNSGNKIVVKKTKANFLKTVKKARSRSTWIMRPMKAWTKTYLQSTTLSSGRWRLRGTLKRLPAWLCSLSASTTKRKEILSTFCLLLPQTQRKAGFILRLLKRST